MEIRKEPSASNMGPDDLSTLTGDELFALLYDTLRGLARRQMLSPQDGTVLQPTALVHEAYLKLVGPGLVGAGPGPERARFLAAAANAMRQVLVEAARRRRTRKRGGGLLRVSLDELAVEPQDQAIDVLALHESLEQFREIDPRAHDVVVLRCFAGLEIAQIANVLDTSERTAKRDWTTARLWLLEKLSGFERRTT